MVTKVLPVLPLVGCLLAFPASAAAVDVGQKPPDFQAESTHGTVRLADYQGKKNVVLAFYFKDFTGG